MANGLGVRASRFGGGESLPGGVPARPAYGSSTFGGRGVKRTDGLGNAKRYISYVIPPLPVHSTSESVTKNGGGLHYEFPNGLSIRRAEIQPDAENPSGCRQGDGDSPAPTACFVLLSWH
jgi:hypothetical protein